MSWYNRARPSKIPEMDELSNRIPVRMNDVLHRLYHRFSNAVSEGLNNTCKEIGSAAYGLRKEQDPTDMCLSRNCRLTARIRMTYRPHLKGP